MGLIKDFIGNREEIVYNAKRWWRHNEIKVGKTAIAVLLGIAAYLICSSGSDLSTEYKNVIDNMKDARDNNYGLGQPQNSYRYDP